MAFLLKASRSPEAFGKGACVKTEESIRQDILDGMYTTPADNEKFWCLEGTLIQSGDHVDEAATVGSRICALSSEI